MKFDVPEAWMAGFTSRWHHGPYAMYLAQSGDYVAGHSGRMGALCLRYFPDASRDLLAAIIAHDLGEFGSGDLSHGTKERNPYYAKQAAVIEGASQIAMGVEFPPLDEAETLRLHWLDRLDAYLWAQIKAPVILETEDFRECFDWLRRTGKMLGVSL